MTDLQAIRDRASAAIPGPWSWRGNVDFSDPYLTAGPWSDVMGWLRVELTREDALRRGVGDLDAFYYDDIKIPEDCEDRDTYWQAQFERKREEYIAEWLMDEYGEPRVETRLAFVDNGFYHEARKDAVFEVNRNAESRNDPSVYRADIVGIRNPNAVFLAHARQDVDDLLAEIDRLNGVIHEMQDENFRRVLNG